MSAPSGTGSRPAGGAASVSTKGFDPSRKLRNIDMFAGIGGFSLGLHRTGGFETVAFAEVEPFACDVFAQQFPGVPNLGDVTKADYPDADFITAGFPCQDISHAGKRAGIAGTRSGLWGEVVRAICLVRPIGALLENVAALLGRGMGRVLGDLAEIGHDAEWNCIPASAVGAAHRRDRIWIFAYRQENPLSPDANRFGSHRAPLHLVGGAELRHEQECQPGQMGQALAHANGPRLEGWLRAGLSECAGKWASGQGGACGLGGHWFTEPNVGRVADGVPDRVDRLKALGNAVVPQIPELIGNAILASLNEQREAA